MMKNFDEKVKSFRALIEVSRRIVFLTGAGISTESGIADYRSQGGLWQQYQPITFQEFLEEEDKRKEYWRRKKEMFVSIQAAAPSAGHLAIARLEREGRLLGVITQNIDGLHAKAGCRHIVELHGTNLEAICLDCGQILPFEEVYHRLLKGEEAPSCGKCGGILKPNTISFGQNLNPDSLRQAFQWADSCDLMICAGSTLIVSPAASLPPRAKNAGAALVILNREETPLDGMADLVVHTELGPFLTLVP